MKELILEVTTQLHFSTITIAHFIMNWRET